MTATMNESREHSWMRSVLIAAGVYNLLWGAVVVFFPAALFRFAEMELPRYPQIWQCVGMIVGVYGIGYLVAASDPLRHWPITLVGLLGKVFGPIGFAGALLNGTLPLAFGATIITNDLIWWIPFAAILYQTFRAFCNQSTAAKQDFKQVIATKQSHRGSTLAELSRQTPTLVVFLRHTGCTFCREALSNIAAQRKELDSQGISLALVHMSEPLQAAQLVSRYGLDSVHRFDDPTCELYSVFGLRRGRFLQLFGPRVWWRGIVAGVFKGHGIGMLSGDGFQMPGAFLLDRGEIVSAVRSRTAADGFDSLSERCAIRKSSIKSFRSQGNQNHELAAQL